MKRFIFTQARLLALRKQEVTLAEFAIATASARVERARRTVAAHVEDLDQLSESVRAGPHGLTLVDQIALGIRARLEAARKTLLEREEEFAAAVDALRRAKIAMESLATLERASKLQHQQLSLKDAQRELDFHSALKWMREDRSV